MKVYLDRGSTPLISTIVFKAQKEVIMRVRPEYDFKVIGNNLRKLRIKNGLTVEEVRQYMQLGTVQSIYKWERGEGLPQADSLIALLELYGENRIDTITEERGNLSSSDFLEILQKHLLNFALNDKSLYLI